METKNYMIKIKNITGARGFLKDLFECSSGELQFVYDDKMLYETNSKKKKVLSSLVRHPIFSALGVFQVLDVGMEENIDAVFSYNRFLRSNKPYIMYLENPLAPVHYAIGRTKTPISKVRLRKLLSDPNLKAIMCLSKACYSTFSQYYDVPDSLLVDQVYPLVIRKLPISKAYITEKSNRETITCLYVSSLFELKGGQDILEAFRQLQGKNIRLIIVSKLETISDKDKAYIESCPTIQLYDFKLSKEELGNLYKESNILLNPSRQDSFSLVLLEAMSYGNAILSTDIYAISEMVSEGEEGYLTLPKYEFWGRDKMPNKKVWNNRKGTIYSSYIDQNVVSFLVNKINLLYDDRNLLNQISQNAFNKATTGEFAKDYIYQKWEKTYKEAIEKRG